jgi:hypothetical protein
VWKDGFFDTPIDLFKEKKFSSLVTRNLSGNFKKGQKLKEMLNISKMIFYKQILDLHSPSKFMLLIEIMKFWQNHCLPIVGVSAETGKRFSCHLQGKS